MCHWEVTYTRKETLKSRVSGVSILDGRTGREIRDTDSADHTKSPSAKTPESDSESKSSSDLDSEHGSFGSHYSPRADARRTNRERNNDTSTYVMRVETDDWRGFLSPSGTNMQPGWTTKMNEKLRNIMTPRCTFVFKRSAVNTY